MEHVFISYKREDRSFVDELENRIIEAGMETWSDNQLRAGESWRLKIDEAIEDAFAMVVVMTPEARKSEYVTYEWSFAMGLGISIIPIMLKETKLHPKLDDLHYLDFTDRYGEPWDVLLGRLEEIKSGKPTYSIRIPRDASPALKNAVEALDSANADIRRDGLDVLRQMNNEEAQEALAQALGHLSLDVRVYAGWILAEKYGDSRSISALIEGILSDEDNIFGWRPFQSRSSTALIAVNNPMCVPILVDLLDNKRGAHFVVEILQRMADESTNLLVDRLLDNTLENKYGILKILQHSNVVQLNVSDRLIQILVELLGDKDCVYSASTILQKMPNEATPYVMNALKNNRFDLNSNTIALLRTINTFEAKDVVRRWDNPNESKEDISSLFK